MERATPDEVLQVLRAERKREFDGLFQDRWPVPGQVSVEAEGGEPLASAARIHDQAQTVLARIDAAEAAMRPVLLAWERDPARRGAHLLAGDTEALADEPALQDPPHDPKGYAQPTVPAGALKADLPDTVPASGPPTVPLGPP